jgi:tRNA-dihydrouridine synthase A
MPSVPIIINRDVVSFENSESALAHVDGVMLGRAAYQEPW